MINQAVNKGYYNSKFWI